MVVVISITSKQQIKSFLGSARKVLFFPFALFDRDTYAAKAKARFAAMGYSIETAHAVSDPHRRLSRQMRSSLVAAILFVC